MSDTLSNKHEQLLQSKFTRILEELNDLSMQDIAVLITNIEKTIREQGKVSLTNIEANRFNPDLYPPRSLT